jgi:hypothetical protein
MRWDKIFEPVVTNLQIRKVMKTMMLLDVGGTYDGGGAGDDSCSFVCVCVCVCVLPTLCELIT